MKKKFIKITIAILIVACVGVAVYNIFNKNNEQTTLNLVDKTWIENNKNNVIDIELISNTPIFNYGGEGLLFDFVSDFEKDTGLEFNMISSNSNDDKKADYSFQWKDKIDDNDIAIYDDNYVIVSLNPKKYNVSTEIPTMVLGVLNNDFSNISSYVSNGLISYKQFNTVNEMMEAMKEGSTNKIDGMVLLKTVYLKEIVENELLNINYNISDMTKTLVLQLGKNKKLNRIIKKYYNKWESEHFKDSYRKYLKNAYYQFSNVNEKQISSVSSKTYKYGFIENGAYDSEISGNAYGSNIEFLKDFTDLIGIDIEFIKYKNNSDLLKAFNENKIDFFYQNTSLGDYAIDVNSMPSNSDEKIYILSNVSNDVNINSIGSLSRYEILSVKNSLIEKNLKSQNVNVKLFDNFEELLANINEDSIVAVDYNNYNAYIHSKFNDFHIIYTFYLADNYSFISRDISDNKIFNKFLSFYLGFTNEKTYERMINYKNYEIKESNKLPIYIIVAVFLLIILAFVVLKLKKKIKVKNKENISREDKIRYIDRLTSLKNRNYLNDCIPKWDESEIYPQAIIIIDLNNIAYINDNYGHEEGDKVIAEAANKLILTQIENTEMIRTDGNEFLIYLVNYDEKQVVSYMRKLNKEFKDLNHGFGAALGYSMIVDGLKTIDDAINEATLDMKESKEELKK